MGMQTDIKAVSLAASGTAFNQRTRIRGALIEPGTSAGSVVFRDGGASGSIVMTINTSANGETFSMVIPADGIVFQIDAYVTLTNAKVTVFYA
jgi:hypothetical protein